VSGLVRLAPGKFNLGPDGRRSGLAGRGAAAVAAHFSETLAGTSGRLGWLNLNQAQSGAGPLTHTDGSAGHEA
jgi:hypothetical protein